MEHLTLTETEFFRLISNPDSRTGLRTAYDEFTQRVIQLCLIPPESGHPVHALSYAETELQYHEALQGRSHESELNQRRRNRYPGTDGPFLPILRHGVEAQSVLQRLCGYPSSEK